MFLNYAILTIVLLLLIYISYNIKNKGIIYFILILLIFITLKNCVDKNKKANTISNIVKNVSKLQENFYNVNTAQEALRSSVTSTNELDSLKEKVGDITTNLTDLTEIMKQQTVNKAMERGSEAKNFSLTESQKRQDLELDTLDKELDVLLKLYRKETENIDKKKYNVLPVFSSCKVKNEGDLYKRDESPLSTQDMIQKLENQEMLKNMGIDSESSNDLLNTMQNGNMADNMDVNINLV